VLKTTNEVKHAVPSSQLWGGGTVAGTGRASVALATWTPSLAETVKELWDADEGDAKVQLNDPTLFVRHGDGTVTTGEPASSMVTAVKGVNLDPDIWTGVPSWGAEGLTVIAGAVPAGTTVTVSPEEQAVLDRASVTR
jgi:hypothetical protein